MSDPATPAAQSGKSGKKKKQQKVKMHLTEFIGGVGGVGGKLEQPAADWGEVMEEEAPGMVGLSDLVSMRKQLPAAPKAASKPSLDFSKIPKNPPYKVFIGNLPFEANEDQVRLFFTELAVEDVELPKNERGNQRGFGYVTFCSSEDMIKALEMSEKTMSARKIKIDFVEASRPAIQGGGRQHGGPTTDFASEDNNWRRSARPQPENGTASRLRDRRPPGSGFGGSDRPPSPDQWRSGARPQQQQQQQRQGGRPGWNRPSSPSRVDTETNWRAAGPRRHSPSPPNRASPQGSWRRSPSPRRKSPVSWRRRSPSPRRRSPSPRRRSPSPRRRSPSPRRRSPSPRRRSPSPRRRSPSPRRHSPSPRRHSPSRRRSSSPRRRSPSPRGRSPSPRGRSPSPRGRSPSPRGRSPSPRRLSRSPRRRSPSPRRRSRSPRGSYSPSPRRRGSRSPKRRFQSPRHRHRSGSRSPQPPRERRKLQLMPRTKKAEEGEAAADPAPNPSIFGSAKPVDTAAAERRIADKLEKQKSSAADTKPLAKPEEPVRTRRQPSGGAVAAKTVDDPDEAVEDSPTKKPTAPAFVDAKPPPVNVWKQRMAQQASTQPTAAPTESGETQQQQQHQAARRGRGGDQQQARQQPSSQQQQQTPLTKQQPSSQQQQQQTPLTKQQPSSQQQQQLTDAPVPTVSAWRKPLVQPAKESTADEKSTAAESKSPTADGAHETPHQEKQEEEQQQAKKPVRRVEVSVTNKLSQQSTAPVWGSRTTADVVKQGK